MSLSSQFATVILNYFFSQYFFSDIFHRPPVGGWLIAKYSEQSLSEELIFRWSSESNHPPQFIVLKLDKPAIVTGIVIF